MWISEVAVAELAVETGRSSSIIAALLNVLQTLYNVHPSYTNNDSITAKQGSTAVAGQQHALSSEKPLILDYVMTDNDKPAFNFCVKDMNFPAIFTRIDLKQCN